MKKTKTTTGFDYLSWFSCTVLIAVAGIGMINHFVTSTDALTGAVVRDGGVHQLWYPGHGERLETLHSSAPEPVLHGAASTLSSEESDHIGAFHVLLMALIFAIAIVVHAYFALGAERPVRVTRKNRRRRKRGDGLEMYWIELLR